MQMSAYVCLHMLYICAVQASIASVIAELSMWERAWQQRATNRQSEEYWGLCGSSAQCLSLTRVSLWASLTGFHWNRTTNKSGPLRPWAKVHGFVSYSEVCREAMLASSGCSQLHLPVDMYMQLLYSHLWICLPHTFLHLEETQSNAENEAARGCP